MTVINGARKVVIGGGTGFVGGALIRQLRINNFTPIIISRTAKPSSEARTAQIQWSDLSKNGFPRDTFAVINLAGKNIADPFRKWNESFKKEVFESRVGTTKFLANLIKDSPIESRPKVFVSTSAVGFYRPSETVEYDEDSKGGNGPDFFSQLTSSWEQVAFLPDSLPVRKVVVRFGLVLGRNGGLVSNFFWPFFFCLGGSMGTGDQWFPWIHISDCAEILVHAIENASIYGILNATAPQFIRNKEFTSAFGKAMCRPSIFPMSEIMIKTIFGAERSQLFLTGQKVYPKRTLASDYQFKYGTIAKAAAEFSRFRLTSEEKGRQISITPSSWTQEQADYKN